METEVGNVFDDVEDLKKAIADEEKKRPSDLKESPIQAQVSYTISPTALPREHANLEQFYQKIRDRFGVTFDDSKMRGLTQGHEVPTVRLMRHQIENNDALIFRHGMLQLEQPARTTPVLQFGLSTESVAGSVAGSTFEAEWITQKGLEDLWSASGVTRTWGDIQKDIQLRAYLTQTRVDLGVNLLDFFSERFRKFVDKNVKERDSFGPQMGKHPIDKELLKAETGNIQVIPHVKSIGMQISLFNELSGRSETCGLDFGMVARHEAGQGFLSITTELDSANHTAFVHELLTNLK